MSFDLNTFLTAAGNEAFEDQPEVPAVPVEPVVPVDPAAPSVDPVVPVDHIEPVTPEVPAAPVVADAPVIPEVPVTPEVPVVPAVDPASVDPVVPVEPVEPVVPVAPVEPVDPVVPVEPTDAPVPEPVPVVADSIDAAAVNAAAAAVADAEEELAIAQGNNTLAVLDGELVSQERDAEEANAAVAHIQEVSAGIEHFMERGEISLNTARLLQQSINAVLLPLGKSGTEVMSGGLEAFGNDPDQVKILLGAGLLELEEEKKSAGSRALNALKGALNTIVKFAGEALSQSKRLSGKIDKLTSEISGKPEKEVSLSSASLMVGKGYTTNLAGDLGKFKDKLVKASNQAITERANWFFKTAPSIVEAINNAETADAAVTAAAKLKIPPMKGASVSVSDGVKRTEVVLGNYAIFEMSSDAAAPTDTASAVEFLKAAAKGRISIQRAKAEAPEAETITMNEATARKILTAASAILTETESLKSVVEGLRKQALDFDGNGSDSDDKDVKKIAGAASAVADGLVDTVSQLPRTATRAAFDVVEASLGVVSAFAKGGAAKPEKEEKDDNKDDKGADKPPKEENTDGDNDNGDEENK